MKNRTIVIALIAFILMATLGYFRDFVFTHINWRLQDLYYEKNRHPLPPILDIFRGLSYSHLYYFKFLLTTVTALMYLGIYYLVVKLIFRENKYLKITLLAFLGIILISSIFYGYGIIFNDFQRGYHLSRIFLGFVQSPLLLMLLIPVFLLDRRKPENI
jgi:hypothetical protein